MNVFISTGAFKTNRIKEIIKIAKENDIRNIEISPGLEYCPDIKNILIKEKNNFQFLFHNYFPTPPKPFALNLASENEQIIAKSMRMCKEAIDFCALMDVPFYSVHCGFCFDTDGTAFGNKSQTKLPRISYNDAKERFVKNIRELCRYSSTKNIKIAIENNVLSRFAKGEEGLLLGVTAEEILELLSMVDMNNCGVLLDFAHAKVSSKTLGFDIDEMLVSLEPYVLEVHLSENNGNVDQNLPLTEESMFRPMLLRIPDKTVTLEVYNLDIRRIKEQELLIKNWCEG